MWILDEEAIFPGATEDSFMDRLFTHHGEQKVKSKRANPQIQRIKKITNVDFQSAKECIETDKSKESELKLRLSVSNSKQAN